MTSKSSDPFAHWEFWTVIRKATNEPLFPEPVRTKELAQFVARGRLRMSMLRDPVDETMHYGMRTDAQVDALLARDYTFRCYKLTETTKKS